MRSRVSKIKNDLNQMNYPFIIDLNQHSVSAGRSSSSSRTKVSTSQIKMQKSATYNYPDGSVYTGDWNSDGQRHGFGVLTLIDGTKYSGGKFIFYNRMFFIYFILISLNFYFLIN
jgi:hypothetical protein